MRTFSSFIKAIIVTCFMFGFTSAFAGAPTWTRVDYTNTTAFVGEVKINFYDAAFPITVVAGDYIGAFVNGECRMIAQVFAYNSSLYVSSVIHGGDIFGTSSAELVEYKVWDNSASIEINKVVKGTMQSAPGSEILDYIIGKPNTNSQLASLSVTGATISPAFATATTAYTVSMTAGSPLPSLASYITTLVDSRATVTITPATDYTTNKVTTIKVTAEDGTITNYTITYSELACTVLAPTVTTPVTYCQNATAAALTATGTSLKWYTAATGGTGSATAPTPPTSVVGSTIYYVSQTTTCESPRAAITVTIKAIPATSTVIIPSVCAGAPLSLSTPTVAGATYAWTGPNAFTSTLQNPVITNATVAMSGTYSIVVTVNGCSSVAGTGTGTVNPVPTIPIVTIPAVCAGASLSLSTSTVAGATYAWTGPNGFTSTMQNPVITNATIAMTGTYSIVVTVNGCSSIVGTGTGTVNPIPAAPIVGSRSYCIGSVSSPLTATGTNLMWYTNATGGTGSATAPTPPTTTAGTFHYFVSQTSNGCEGPRADLVVIVNPNPTPIITGTPALTVCQGTAISLSTGITVVSNMWSGSAVTQLNSASLANPTFSASAPAGTYNITVNVTDANACVGTDTKTITINAAPANPTVTSPVNYCIGATATALSATGTTLKWYTVPTGGTSSPTAPTPITSVVGTTTYYVSQTIGTCESNRAPIVVNINALPTVSITPSATSVCSDGTISLTLVPTTGGTLSGSTGVSGLTFNPATAAAGLNTIIYSYTDANLCSNSASRGITVYQKSLPITTQTLNLTIGDPSPTLTATGSGTIKWYDASNVLQQTGTSYPIGINTNTIGTYTYYVTNTNGICESAQVTVTVTVSNCTVAAPTVVSPVNYCIGAATTALSATGTALKWYTVPTGGTSSTTAPTPSSAILGTTTYYVSQYTTCESGRAAIVVNINAIPTVSITSSATSVCSDETVTLTLVPATGGTLTGSTGVSGLTFNPATAAAGLNTVTYSYTDANLCSNSASRGITVYQKSLPTTNQTVSLMNGDPSPTLTATGSGTIKWYNSSNVLQQTGTSYPIGINTSIAGTYIYYVTNTTGICESAPVTVTVTVSGCGASAPIVSSPVKYCIGSTATALTATGSTLLWYSAATGGTGSSVAPTPSTAIVGTTTYYVSQTTTCESPRAPIDVTVYAKPTVSISSNVTEVCSDGTVSLTLVPATGGTLTGSPAVSGLAFIPSSATVGLNTITYSYIDANSCSNTASTGITVYQKSLPTTNQTVTLMLGDPSPTLTATGSGTIKWYNSSNVLQQTGTSYPIGINTSTAGTYTYYVTNTNNICESNTVLVTVTVSGCAATAPTVTSPVEYCQGETATALTASGSNLKWYTVATGGTGSATAPIPSTNISGTTTYYVSQTTTCESSRTAILVTVKVKPTAPTVTSPVTYCIGATSTVLTASGSSLLWYTAAVGGIGSVSAPTPSTAIAGTTNNYVSQTINGCESDRAIIAVIINSKPTVSITPDAIEVCSDGSTNLTLVPATGGTLSGSIGVSGLTFNPSAAPEGLNTLTYSYTDANLCSNTATTGITVYQKSLPTTVQNIPLMIGSTSPTLIANGNGIIKWYNSTNVLQQTGTSFPIGINTSTAGTYTYYVSNTVGVCESAKVLVTVSVSGCATLAPTVTTPVNYCIGATATALTATGSNIQWYTGATGGTPSAIAPIPSTAVEGSTLYYVSQTTTCESSRAAIEVIVKPKSSQPTTNDVTVCQGQTIPTLTASGSNLKWYNSGGAQISSPVNPTGQGSYFVTQDVNGCESDKKEIVVSVNLLPIAPQVSDVLVTYGQTVPNLTAVGTNLKWYANATLQNPTITQSFATGKVDPGVYTYYVTQTTNNCESPSSPISLTIDCSINAPSVVKVLESVCEGQSFTFSAIITSGYQAVWTNSSNQIVGNSATYTTSLAGVYNVKQQNANGTCISSPTEVTLYTKTVPAAPVVTNVITCEASQADITFSKNAKWYVAQTDIIPVYTGVVFTPNVTLPNVYTYYVSEVSNGCEGAKSPVTYTIVAKPSVTVSDLVVTFGSSVPDLSVVTNALNTVTWFADDKTTQLGNGMSYTTLKTAIGLYTYYVQAKTPAQCASDVLPVTLQITDCNIPAPTVSATKSQLCVGGTNPVLDAQGINPIRWYSDAALTQLVSNNASFTPADTDPGYHTYYAVQYASCVSPSKSISFKINELPNPQIFATSSVLITDSPVLITVSPLGGSLLGTGLSGNYFNPSSVTAGYYNLMYSYTDVNSCSNSVTHTIQVIGVASVDRTQLGDTLARANNVYTTYLNDSKYTTTAKIELQNAITIAQYYYDNYTSYTNADMLTQTLALSDAISAFLQSSVSSVDVSALVLKIEEANKLYNDNIGIQGTAPGQIPSGSFTILQNAIIAAQAKVTNPPATQLEVANEVIILADAMQDFLDSKVPNPDVQSISVADNLIHLIVGEKYTPVVVFDPIDSYGDIQWVSANTSIASVIAGTGVITAKAKGTTSIVGTLISNPSISVTIVVQVSGNPELVSTSMNNLGNKIILSFSEPMLEPTADIYTDIDVVGVSPFFYTVTNAQRDPNNYNNIILSLGSTIDNPNEVSISYSGNSLQSVAGAQVASFNVQLVGIEDIADVSIWVYPTISESIVNVEGVEIANSLKVISASGQIVIVKDIQNNKEQIDISKLAQGAYTILIIKDNAIITKASFIKK